MTDEEKAATFIGWKPCVYDDSPEASRRRIRRHEDNRCLTHGFTIRFSGCPQESPPDMHDPRNYMKALEVAAVRKLRPAIVYDEECGQWHCDMAVRPGGGCDAHYADDIAPAVIMAFVALYDAEHKE